MTIDWGFTLTGLAIGLALAWAIANNLVERDEERKRLRALERYQEQQRRHEQGVALYMTACTEPHKYVPPAPPVPEPEWPDSEYWPKEGQV